MKDPFYNAVLISLTMKKSRIAHKEQKSLGQQGILCGENPANPVLLPAYH